MATKKSENFMAKEDTQFDKLQKTLRKSASDVNNATQEIFNLLEHLYKDTPHLSLALIAYAQTTLDALQSLPDVHSKVKKALLIATGGVEKEDDTLFYRPSLSSIRIDKNGQVTWPRKPKNGAGTKGQYEDIVAPIFDTHGYSCKELASIRKKPSPKKDNFDKFMIACEKFANLSQVQLEQGAKSEEEKMARTTLQYKVKSVPEEYEKLVIANKAATIRNSKKAA